MKTMFIKRTHVNAVIPKKGSKTAAGYDLCSVDSAVVPAWGKVLVATGLVIAIPDECYGRIASRSGLSFKNDIEIGAGVIDSDYRGEVKIILRNFSDTPFTVKVGDRVAQIIIEMIASPEIQELKDLSDTDRSDGGFGSTGVGISTIGTPTVDNIKIVIDDQIVKVANEVQLKCKRCQSYISGIPADNQNFVDSCLSCRADNI